MRIFFKSLSHPKKASKRLKHLSTLSLSQAQDITAYTLGYRNWWELKRITQEGKRKPSSFDEDTHDKELERRFDYQLERYNEKLASLFPELYQNKDQWAPFLEVYRPSAKNALSEDLRWMSEDGYSGNYFKQIVGKTKNLFILKEDLAGSYCYDFFGIAYIAVSLRLHKKAFDILESNIKYLKYNFEALNDLYRLARETSPKGGRKHAKVLSLMRAALLEVTESFDYEECLLSLNENSNSEFVHTLRNYIKDRSNVEVSISSFARSLKLIGPFAGTQSFLSIYADIWLPEKEANHKAIQERYLSRFTNMDKPSYLH